MSFIFGLFGLPSKCCGCCYESGFEEVGWLGFGHLRFGYIFVYRLG